jgi:hypothetical protein
MLQRWRAKVNYPMLSMKKANWILIVIASLLSGCATRYDVKITGGGVITSKGKPKLNGEGYYVFKDLNGQVQHVPHIRVLGIYAQTWGQQEESGPQFSTKPSKFKK